MANQTKVRKSNATKALTKAEAAVLARLNGLKDASRQAAYAYSNLFRYHRGSYLSRGTCVIYGNDGFSTDVRSQREAVRVAKQIEEMGYEIEGFGLAGEGYTWALTIRFEPGTGREEREYVDSSLNSLVSDVWMEMAGFGPSFATKMAIE
jgi:hypothetical protein